MGHHWPRLAKGKKALKNAENAQKTLAIDLSITTVRALLLRAEMSLDPTQLILLAQQGQSQSQGSPIGMIGYMGIFFVLMYFLFIRPQKLQAKKQKEMQDNLKSGASVVTRGGVVGTVQSVKDTTVTVRSLESKFEVEKHAIERVINNNSDLKTDNK